MHVLLIGAVFKRWLACGAALAWLGVSAYISARSCLMIRFQSGFPSSVCVCVCVCVRVCACVRACARARARTPVLAGLRASAHA